MAGADDLSGPTHLRRRDFDSYRAFFQSKKIFTDKGTDTTVKPPWDSDYMYKVDPNEV